MEREPVHLSPLEIAVQNTQEFVKEKIEQSPAYKIATSSIIRKLKSENPAEDAEKLIKQGISMITFKVGLLPSFSNPENRKKVMENFKDEKGEWLEILNSWDVKSDSYGIGVLQRCKAFDVDAILDQTKEVEAPEQIEQIKMHALAVEKGQDLVLSFYANQTGTSQIAA